jgi:hypothetical protein
LRNPEGKCRELRELLAGEDSVGEEFMIPLRPAD